MSVRNEVPRITPADIEGNIAAEHYFTGSEGVYGAAKNPFDPKSAGQHVLGDFPLMGLTFCVLTLKNGFVVTGESACVDSRNFDAEKGRQYARENAIEKLWPLMGYALKEKLSQA